jgi:hypothetical protein
MNLALGSSILEKSTIRITAGVAGAMEPIYRDWGDPRDQHLVGDWYKPLPRRIVNNIHPLAFQYSRWIWEKVFSGVKNNPFDPRKATGWMEKLFKSRERQDHRASKSGKALKDTLIDQFGWKIEDQILMLYAPEHGYQTYLSTFLEYQTRFLIYFDTGILCHPSDQNVVVFWECNGPYFGCRRDRCLT